MSVKEIYYLGDDDSNGIGVVATSEAQARQFGEIWLETVETVAVHSVDDLIDVDGDIRSAEEWADSADVGTQIYCSWYFA